LRADQHRTKQDKETINTDTQGEFTLNGLRAIAYHVKKNGSVSQGINDGKQGSKNSDKSSENDSSHNFLLMIKEERRRRIFYSTLMG
jgi:hypothetical protein